MENETYPEIYTISPPEIWTGKTDDAELINKIHESEFSRQQIESGRDFCYFLDRKYRTSDTENSEYTFMAYTLNEPANLERASVSDIVLEEHELYNIHRIAVLREGVLIDKIKDTKIKVLDSENMSGGGVLSSNKKLNITIKDLRLNDVLILEDTKVKIFSERDFLRKDFSKYVYVSPDGYWAYGDFKFSFINGRDSAVAYKKMFFRDGQGNVLDPETGLVKKGESFQIHEQNYVNPVDVNREVSPFIDFATEKRWQELSDYMACLYDEIFTTASVKDFAPTLAEKIDAISSVDDKIQFAIEYVQNNIYYIFNAGEMNGHRPQHPSVTYENKQGECKAKSVLLKVILDYIGVDSSVVLVNFHTDYYLKYYLPSLLSFNHVIVKINHNNDTHFVDATIRDEFGHLENRGFIFFLHYLEVKAGQVLEKRNAYEFPYYCIDEKVNFKTEKTTGKLELTTKYRGNRANAMRRYFKNTNRREITDGWNNFLYHNLNYVSDRNGTDVRTIFKDAAIDVVSDDKKLNEFTVKYSATVENPYYTDAQGNRFLMYYDRNVTKPSVRDFIHKDVTFWNNFDREKYEINLYTDQKIDSEEKYTLQESTIENPYFSYSSRKKVTKHGASAFIEANPKTNVEIPHEDFETFRAAHGKVADSNFGLGIDIIEPGLMNMLRFSFKKTFK